jgi:hypothetical protein
VSYFIYNGELFNQREAFGLDRQADPTRRPNLAIEQDPSRTLIIDSNIVRTPPVSFH